MHCCLINLIYVHCTFSSYPFLSDRYSKNGLRKCPRDWRHASRFSLSSPSTRSIVQLINPVIVSAIILLILLFVFLIFVLLYWYYDNYYHVLLNLVFNKRIANYKSLWNLSRDERMSAAAETRRATLLATSIRYLVTYGLTWDRPSEFFHDGSTIVRQ